MRGYSPGWMISTYTGRTRISKLIGAGVKGTELSGLKLYLTDLSVAATLKIRTVLQL